MPSPFFLPLEIFLTFPSFFKQEGQKNLFTKGVSPLWKCFSCCLYETKKSTKILDKPLYYLAIIQQLFLCFCLNSFTTLTVCSCQVWPNGWVFVYKLSGSGFEFSCSDSFATYFEFSNFKHIVQSKKKEKRKKRVKCNS